MQGGGGSRLTAFTMAEILLSLTIIGVVAAITLPSLTGNINERTWNTQRKALYARMSQAISLMPSLNGYGTLTEGDESTSAVDTAAETFVTAGLSKVLKINNICDNTHLSDCGIVSSYTDRLGSVKTTALTLYELNGIFSRSILDTKTAAFETQNGESILVYYNPFCRQDLGVDRTYVAPFMCANFIYDLNGNKGPNVIGKDMGFITAMYPSDSKIVAPVVIMQKSRRKHYDASKLCRQLDSESRVPSIEELSAMVYNDKLLNLSYVNRTWSATTKSSTKAYTIAVQVGERWLDDRSYNDNEIYCIKR